MTVARLLTGKVVTQNGAVGVAAECCDGCGGTGPDGCGCPAVTITFNITVVIPEADASNDPSSAGYTLVPAGTYTATLVLEFSGLTQAFGEASCIWFKCANTDQATAHGITVVVSYPLGSTHTQFEILFDPEGVDQPATENGPCTYAGSFHAVGSTTPNAGWTTVSPRVVVNVPGDPNAPCEWPASMSGSDTCFTIDNIPDLNIDFSWEITFS